MSPPRLPVSPILHSWYTSQGACDLRPAYQRTDAFDCTTGSRPLGHPFLRKNHGLALKQQKTLCGRRRSRNLKLSDRKVFSRYLCSGFSEWGKWLPRHGFYRSRTRVSGLDARRITSMLSAHIKNEGFSGFCEFTPVQYCYCSEKVNSFSLSLPWLNRLATPKLTTTLNTFALFRQVVLILRHSGDFVFSVVAPDLDGRLWEDADRTAKGISPDVHMVVEVAGFEPTTPGPQGQCSAGCAIPR